MTTEAEAREHMQSIHSNIHSRYFMCKGGTSMNIMDLFKGYDKLATALNEKEPHIHRDSKAKKTKRKMVKNSRKRNR